MTGLPAGDNVTIGSDEGDALFTYRSFASAVPLVAMVVAVVVIVTGLAAIAFLMADNRPVPAIIALVLSAAFTVLVAMLVPATNVTLFNDKIPVLTIAQQSNVSFPVVTYVVATPDRKVIGRIRRTVWSRIGRHRWTLIPGGYAIEESFSRALVRKVAGKFHPRYQSNMVVHYRGKDAAWITRRPDAQGESDILEITGDIDHRLAVALATLVLGGEP
jgi:hypothetical protein